jgi:hypothetical protein
VAGEEQPRERDVLELAQVAELVADGQASLVGPAQRLGQPALPDPHPRLHRGNGTHLGIRASDIQLLRLIEQIERAVQVSLRLRDPRHADVPAVPVLRQPTVLAKLLAAPQVA